MRLPRNLKVFRGQLEAAPFLSVVLLLLILLSLVPNLLFDPGVPIQLDLHETSTPLPGIRFTNDVVSVAIDSSGLFYYEGQVNPLPTILAGLNTAIAARLPAPLSLKIYADRSVKLDAMQQLVSEATQLGFQEVVLVTATPIAPAPLKATPASNSSPPANRR